MEQSLSRPLAAQTASVPTRAPTTDSDASGVSVTLDFSLPDLPIGTDPGSRLVLWRAFAPAADDDQMWLRAVMITSIDGTSTIDGVTAGLGTPADARLFQLMRDRADVILVGSSTALSEDYGPHNVATASVPLRDRPAPEVILMARTNVIPAIEHCARRGPTGLSVATARPTQTEIDAARDAGVTLHELGDELGQGVRDLMGRIGAREVTFEGGPELLTKFFAAALIDELVLTFSPQVVFRRDDQRLVSEGEQDPVGMRVHSAFSARDGGLYSRWLTEQAFDRISRRSASGEARP